MCLCSLCNGRNIHDIMMMMMMISLTTDYSLKRLAIDICSDAYSIVYAATR